MKNGPYELVIAPEDYPGKKYRGKYVYEHHLVWWLKTGKVTSDKEVVHHINGNKRDNSFDNLEILSNNDHASLHHKEKTIYELVCKWCGNKFQREARNHSFRDRQRDKNTFCSRRCNGKYTTLVVNKLNK